MLTTAVLTIEGYITGIDSDRLSIISFTLYPAYISSVVIVGFLFNKSSLNLYFLVDLTAVTVEYSYECYLECRWCIPL